MWIGKANNIDKSMKLKKKRKAIKVANQQMNFFSPFCGVDNKELQQSGPAIFDSSSTENTND